MDVLLVIMGVVFVFYVILDMREDHYKKKLFDLNESLIKAQYELIEAQEKNIKEKENLIGALLRKCSAMEERMRSYERSEAVKDYLKKSKKGVRKNEHDSDDR